MTKGCKKFQELIKINLTTTVASDFINRFCSKLDMSTANKQACHLVVNKVDELSIVSENTPPSVAAGVIYLCSQVYNWKLSKKALAEACDISQVTISKCYKKMEAYIEHLF